MDKQTVRNKLEEFKKDLEIFEEFFKCKQNIEKPIYEFLSDMTSKLFKQENLTQLLEWCDISISQFEEIKREREKEQNNNSTEISQKTFLDKCHFLYLLELCKQKYLQDKQITYTELKRFNQNLSAIRDLFNYIFQNMQSMIKSLNEEDDDFTQTKNDFNVKINEYLQKIENQSNNDKKERLINNLKLQFENILQDLNQTFKKIEVEAIKKKKIMTEKINYMESYEDYCKMLNIYLKQLNK